MQMASILTTAILARILSNEDFGLVAISVVVVAMFDLITSVGIGASVVRIERLSDGSISTLFWASVVIGLSAGGLAAAGSGPAAALAGNPAAAPLVAVAALVLPANLAAKVPTGLLTRSFRFRTLAIIAISGSVLHGVVATALALQGLGAWAVVIGQVLRSVFVLASAWIVSGFRPHYLFDWDVVKSERSYSGGLFAGALVSYANKNADYWFVGNQLGTGPLGIYYVAYVVPTLLRRRVTSIGHDVIFPVVSRMQDDPARVVSAYLRVVRLISFIVLPAMTGLVIVADLAVLVGFGADWLDAVTPLRLIAASAAVTSMTVMANPIFPALGKPGILVTTGLVALLVLGVGLAFSVSVGTLGAVAVAVLAASVVESAVIQIRLRRLIGVSHRDFIDSVTPFVASSLIMAAGVVGVRATPADDLSPFLTAPLLLISGVAVYLLVGGLLFQKAFRDQLESLKALVLPGR